MFNIAHRHIGEVGLADARVEVDSAVPLGVVRGTVRS
jgi:hypothetical protein